MTEDCKEKAPGMAEVSVKCAPEVEDPILALKRDFDARYMSFVKPPDDTEETSDRLHDAVNEVEYEIFQTPATTLTGITIKLVLWARQHVGHDASGLSWSREPVEDYPMDLDKLPVVSALHDLERMAGENTAVAPVDITDAVVLLRQRWEEVGVERGQLNNRDDENPKHPDVIEDARLHDIQRDIEESIASTPTGTAAGIAGKLRQLQRNETEFDGDAPWRPAAFRTALEALGHTTTPAEIPPAEDAALFDALAGYDRLVAISQDLERRKDVFRPGIPEAKEADKAYEAAHDETMEAWATARDIPATTQAGLFAKLQATIRFMTDLEVDELYETEWCAIKADVQRIAGEARS